MSRDCHGVTCYNASVSIFQTWSQPLPAQQGETVDPDLETDNGSLRTMVRPFFVDLNLNTTKHSLLVDDC